MHPGKAAISNGKHSNLSPSLKLVTKEIERIFVGNIFLINFLKISRKRKESLIDRHFYVESHAIQNETVSKFYFNIPLTIYCWRKKKIVSSLLKKCKEND